jgi:HSP20 family protein
MAMLVRHREGSPARWEPFRELEQLQEQTLELLENAWSGRPADGLTWTPPVDIEETEDAWIVEAEIPGVKRQDVNVETRDSELLISGEIKERERTGILRRRTRRVGEFEFRVTLPGGLDPNNVEANVDDGVLSVRIPKPEQARPQRVEVTSQGENGGSQPS